VSQPIPQSALVPEHPCTRYEARLINCPNTCATSRLLVSFLFWTYSLLHAKQLWATEYEQADVIGIDESQVRA